MSYDCGLWQTTAYFNAQTLDFHTKDDWTYTVITVPKKEHHDTKYPYNFVFKPNDEKYLSIKMIPGSSFPFTGKYVTHK